MPRQMAYPRYRPRPVMFARGFALLNRYTLAMGRVERPSSHQRGTAPCLQALPSAKDRRSDDQTVTRLRAPVSDLTAA